MNELRRGSRYIHNEILLSHKKEQNNAIYSNINGPRDDHIKLNQRQISYDITNIWNLKVIINKLIYKTETDP